MDHKQILEVVGREILQWLSGEFSKYTMLKEIPDEILNRMASVDIKIRDYSSDRNSITSIALLTFAYRMANKVQEARFGPNDILLLKVLAKTEKLRRQGKGHPQYELWDLPLCELITGEVGDRIRDVKMINSHT
ncbi:MAG: hypothetical protein U9N82_04500 [Thermodesulfobacteriota bacterium]|nr:hypothetical protein [Thermodesulfobacteriota bacterium]